MTEARTTGAAAPDEGAAREEGSGSGAGGHGEEHVSDRTYLAVAGILAVLTALEVMVFYVPALEPVLVPILVVMMVGKFVLVAMFFMHLKYDSPVLTGIFTGALTVSVIIVLALMALYEKLFVF